MNVLIDADGCPVVEITLNLCRKFHISCTIFCDTAHEIHKDGAQTVICDKGTDSVDFFLANRVCPRDIVVTQDYGLASMCLAKNAFVLHQDGWQYTRDNIDALLFQRHAARQYRASGGRVKGPSKRKPSQNTDFENALTQLLQTSVQG
ncbi:MAG: DUF188 domain-containing protein [Oscillospiraceae bacterium]|nr:DUF188 domain-containing protein [Oscillospiraceae bacterium]